MKLSELVRRNYEKEHRIYERKMRPYFYRAVKTQNDAIINYIELNGTENIPYDLLINTDTFFQSILPGYLEVGLVAARREYYFIKKSTNETKASIEFLINKWRDMLIEFATNYAYRIQNELTETTKQDIIDALIYGSENNLTGNKLIAYLRSKVGNQISKFRANLIARTEATTASNYAKEIGAREWIEQSGEKGYKGWISRIDERVRHTHFDNNGKYTPIDNLWNVGNEKAKQPGDTRLSAKERIQCRCTQVFVTESTYQRLIKRGEIKK